MKLNFAKTFFLLYFIIISISSIEEDDLIDLTDYKYPLANDSSTLYIPILATNDLHGGIFPSQFSDSNRKKFLNGGANYLYSYKKILKEEWGDRLIWIDGGDQFQGTMECMLSKCLIMKDFYNKAGLDGIALGNHDFDYTIEYLMDYVKQMDFPLIVANVKEKKTGKYIYETWDNVVAYKIFEYNVTKEGKEGLIRIGVIGLATIGTYTSTSTNISIYDITNYVDETIKWNNYLRDVEKVDAVIVLPHFGPRCTSDGAAKYELKMWQKTTSQSSCEANQEIMAYLKSLKDNNVLIDGIVAAHVHDIVHHWIEDIPIVESSGADYFNILYLAFTYNTKEKKYKINNNKITIEGPVPICEKLWPDTKNCEYKFKDSTQMKNFKFHGTKVELDQEMKQVLEYWEKFVLEKIANNIGEADEEIKTVDSGESVLANFVNDVGRIVTGSDICFYNSGGIRSTWHKGPINEIDLFKMFPFNNTWVTFEMTGEEVFHMFQVLDNTYFYPSSGLIHTYKETQKPDYKQYTIKSLRLYNGFEEKPLDFKKTYKICTNDFLAEGGSRMKHVREWYKELRNRVDIGIIREKIGNFMKQMKGHLRVNKFVDENYPRYIIENY